VHEALNDLLLSDSALLQPVHSIVYPVLRVAWECTLKYLQICTTDVNTRSSIICLASYPRAGNPGFESSTPMATFSTPEELADALAQACEGSASAAYDFCASTLTLLEMLKDEESKKPSIQPPLPPRPTEDPITTAELQEVEPPLPPVPQESAAAVGSDGWGLAIMHRPLFMVYDFVKTPPPVRPRAPDGSPPMSATYDDRSLRNN
jgi:hypothetical protein